MRELNEEEERDLALINGMRKKWGKPPMSLEEFLVLIKEGICEPNSTD